MKTDKLIIGLVTMTLIMQIFLLYRRESPPAQDVAARSQRPAIADADPNTTIDISEMAVRGENGAQAVLIEFSDYECPYCQRHATSVGPQVYETFVVTGQLRQAFANNPLQIHQNAKLLATAALCAGEQGHYWEMHDSLFGTKPKEKSEILAHAKGLGVDTQAMEKCLGSTPEGLTKRIVNDQRVAQQLRLTGTPAFALGMDTGKGKVTVKKIIFGAQPFDVFEKAIKEVVTKSAALTIAKP